MIQVGNRTIDDFTAAYMEAALWSSNDNSDESGGEPLDKNYGFEDFAPEALQRMIDDCIKFRLENPIPDYNHPQYTDAELAGHDFWLTRNGHGAGFWDRGLGEIGKKLTDAAHAYGECDIYVGDDGKLYLL